MHTHVAKADSQLASWEANHRFLNTLTALHGLLLSDFGDFADPAVRSAVSVFSSRIQAFASIHRTLGEDTGEGCVDAAAHLARLCEELTVAHLAPRGLHCDFRADPGALPQETCQKLGLIIVELITNAAKHAFAGRSGGRITVCLRRAERGWICQVGDNGSGLQGQGKGHGMHLVRRLVAALGGELRVHSDGGGVIVTLCLPVPPLAPPVRAAATAFGA